ncbi:MAG: peptidoglycan-binding protein [Minisyncoccia bacterium]|jgi:hypothetical protein
MKKLLGASSLILGLLLSLGFVAAPAQAAALTSAQISAIVSLLQSFGADSSTIANVQNALGAGQTAPSIPCSCPMIPVGSTSSCSCPGGTGTTPPIFCNSGLSQNLGVGATGSEVTDLQQSLGVQPTGYYGALTKAAVMQWQSEHNVAATGYVGPLTRTAFVIWCGGGVTPPQPSNFNVTPTSGVAPLPVVFSGSLPNNGSSGSYAISFGDGTSNQSIGAYACPMVATSSGVFPCSYHISHTYASAGTYTATLLNSGSVVGSATVTVINGNGIACPADAMQCPNGTYVGRSGPNCTFTCN